MIRNLKRVRLLWQRPLLQFTMRLFFDYLDLVPFMIGREHFLLEGSRKLLFFDNGSDDSRRLRYVHRWSEGACTSHICQRHSQLLVVLRLSSLSLTDEISLALLQVDVWSRGGATQASRVSLAKACRHERSTRSSREALQ